jgi:hypothetical protein
MAIPPESGGFMTGQDSALYICWFHPQLHCYEQGIDTDKPEEMIHPSEEPGHYCMIQRGLFPAFSCINGFSAKIYQGDEFPDLPGDKFSPFGYAAYFEGGDSLPNQPAIAAGRNRLCEGVPCGDEWVFNPIGLPDPAGENIWFGFEWDYETPTAPAIMGLVLSHAYSFNKIGIQSGEFYQWQNMQYAVIFRNSFLSLLEADTSVSEGWRRSLKPETRPDGFQIKCYHGSLEGGSSPYICGVDTLIFQAPDGMVDSAAIFALYEGIPDDSAIILRFDGNLVTPIIVGLDYLEHDKILNQYVYDLKIANLHQNSLELILGFDSNWVEGSDRRITIVGESMESVRLAVYDGTSGERRIPLVIQDRLHRYYPYLVMIEYPPQGPTGIDDQQEDMPLPSDYLIAYPNPKTGEGNVHLKSEIKLVLIEVFNIVGQKVYENSSDYSGEIIWDGCGRAGAKLPAGIYFARIRDLKGTVLTKKLIILP